jgi:hypothetical protein
MLIKKTVKDLFVNNWEWLVLILVLFFVFIIRMHFLSVPLERDEGEYAYMGQLMLKGIPPYESAYNMKFPGTYAIYAIIMFFFGQTVVGIHFGFLLINLLSSILLYLFFSKIINQFVGLVTASLFSLMSLSFVFLGFAAHATHFVLFFALLGFFVLTLKKNKWYIYLISGLCFSTATLMKQQGIFFILPGFVFLILTIDKNIYRHYAKLIKPFLLFIVGLLLPILIVFISLIINGTFKTFWFWTVTYASTYATQGTFGDAWLLFLRMINYIGEGAGLWVVLIMMVLGILVLFFSKKDFLTKEKKVFLLTFFLFSFLTIVPGFYFRPHYFITLIPAITLLVGIFFYWLLQILKNKLLLFLLIIVAILPFFIKNFDYFFIYNSQEIIRRSYGFMPFYETQKISAFIKENTNAEDKIFMFGSEPELYFYTNRISATGYIYMYALMEKQPYSSFMQKEMINQVEKAEPKYILFSGERTSWLMNKDSNTHIFIWAESFLKDYKRIEVVDIYSNGSVQEFKGEILNSINPNPLLHILTLYKRID